MAPRLALFIGSAAIAWLLYQDVRLRPFKSPGLWVAGAWLAIIGSRPIGYWLEGVPGVGSGANADGSPLNLVVQGFLILASGAILSRRRFSWAAFAADNKAIVLIYLYFLASSLWAPDPFVCLRRIVKDFGCVVVALVLLTEREPLKAIRATYVRCSYLLLILSVVFIKYYPEIGRNAAKNGDAMFTGVTTQKNSLGEICVVFTMMLLWDLIALQFEEGRPGLRAAKRIRWAMLVVAGWLVVTCQSKTSLLCILIGAALLGLSRPLLRAKRPGRALAATAALVAGMAALDGTLDLSGSVVELLGRNKTLTGRTEIWSAVRAQGTDPLIGYGFYSFWDGKLGRSVAEDLTTINEAHNGYLEVYLDGGAVGVALLLAFLLSSGATAVQRLLQGGWFGSMAFAILVIALVYNFSETNFFRLTPLWTTLLLVTMTARAGAQEPATAPEVCAASSWRPNTAPSP